MQQRTGPLAPLLVLALGAALLASGCPQFIDRSADAGEAPSDAGQPAEDAGGADAALRPDAGAWDAATGDAGEDGGTDACVPSACADLPGACGDLDDGCGGTLSCGCSYTHSCGAVEPSVCGCASEAWTVRTADNGDNVGLYTSMARDAEGNVHVAYVDAYGGVKHAVFGKATPWLSSVEQIDPDAEATETSIAVDAAGTLHVAYYRWTYVTSSSWDGELWYASKPQGGEWSLEKVISAGYECYVWGGGSTLRLDPGGGVHLLFTSYVYNGADFYSASRLGSGTWDVQRVFEGARLEGATPADAGRPGFAIGPDGTLHAAFEHYLGGDLFYATRPPGGAWTAPAPIIEPATLQAIGLQTRMEVDARGVHLAFWSWLGTDHTDLRYGFLPAGEGAWHFEPIDPPAGQTGHVGGHTAFALDPQGGLHVVYLEHTTVELRHAHRDAQGVWQIETIDASGNAGTDGSVLAEADALHVAYYQWGADQSGKLRYAWRCRAP